MRNLGLALVLILSSAVFAQQNAPEAAGPGGDEAAVRAVLNAQMEAWNQGNLEKYMDVGYWNSPELAFIGGANEVRGYQNALERYRKSYKSPGHEMGHLDFPEMRVTMLGADAAMATGKFHLKMSDGREPSGRFTVILRKFTEGWRIVHDHSCS